MLGTESSPRGLPVLKRSSGSALRFILSRSRNLLTTRCYIYEVERNQEIQLFCSALLSLLRTVAKFLLITRCYICEVERNLELQLFCSASSCHARMITEIVDHQQELQK
ncbi:hypothetical protein ABFA07_015556 [Porites harrisoni]